MDLMYWLKFCLCLGAGTAFILVIVMVGLHLYINDFPRRRQHCKSKVKLNGKTALVTGSNHGIGYETAKELARRGARVIMGCRNRAKAEIARQHIIDATGNTNIVVEQLDLSDLDSVRSFAEKIIASENYLHILINNAGIGHDPKTSKTKQGFQMVFGTNHIGPFLLTYLLLDLLKKSAPSRIVNVSSIVYKVASGLDFTERDAEGNLYPNLDIYPHSKLANILHARHLSKILEGTGVTTYCLCPGFVKTAIFDPTQEAAVQAVGRMLLLIQWALLGVIALDWWSGAQTTLHCALEESLETVSGRYYDNCREVSLSGKYASDDNLAHKLWDFSMKMTGLK